MRKIKTIGLVAPSGVLRNLDEINQKISTLSNHFKIKKFYTKKGKRAKVVGRICMDQFMVDVTDIEDIRCGMMATLIGKDGDEEITIDELAEMCGTINYDIVCNISLRVKRYYHN